MPTLLDRTSISITPDIERALALAKAVWPEANGQRSELLRRLILTGGEAVSTDADQRLAEHQAVADELAGCMTGVFPPDAVESLRAEWPA
jgi:hypothetical protein